MSEKDNIHAGHRERMIKKLKDNRESLLEHEVLEIMLFPMLPRVNTNPIAHRLLKAFGGIEEVLTASVEELSLINGIGEKTATQICLLGQVFNRFKEAEKKEIKLTSFEKVRSEVERYFHGEKEERIYLFLLSSNYKKIAVIEFADEKATSVNAEVPEIAKAFAIYKPKNVIIAHNHPSGLAMPSEKDDFATKKINLLCMAHGVNLSDHVIYAKEKVYSYATEGRLNEIKNKSNLNELLNKL